MAIKTKAQLAAESAATFADNTNGDITPVLHRTYNTDTIDSFLTSKDASELQAVMLENRSSSKASANTVDLSTADGNFVHITGSITIAGFGTVQAGARFVLLFEAALTLQYNSVSLILPTSANITTAIGDTAFMISEGGGNWRCVAYQRKSGAALVGGGGGGGTWGSITGTLSDQTDLQGALDAKIDENAAITGATKTKISYDVKGLVTAGADAAIVDITGLQTALDGKFDDPTGSTSQYLRGDGSLATFPTIPAAQIQSDWTQTNNAALDYIKNKPTVGSGTVTSIATAGLLSGGTITSSGTITTSINTNKLVGRSSASAGVMEEIAVGSGLTLSGGTLTNTATPTPLGYYGAFQDQTIQTAAAINTPYAMKFGLTDLNNGVTIVSDGSNLTRITFAYSGVYNIQFSAQFDRTNSGTDVVDIWLRKNGADVAGTGGKIVLTGSAAASPLIATWNYVLDVIGTDYYQLMWSTPDTHVRILYEAAQTSPFAHPIIPSTILTVTQQSGIMAGSGLTALNGISAITNPVQTFATNGSGSDFNIASTGTTHTFNLPTASASVRGALSSANWTTFNNKQDAITGGATTITSSNLALSKALVSDASGKVAAATTTALELGYVSGVSSAIQTQFSGKAPTNLVGSPCEIQTAVSDETTSLTTGTSKMTFRMPYAMTVTSVRASVNTAPTGSAISVDVKENGTSIMTTTKISIAATTKTSVGSGTPVITDSALADDSEISIDILTVGSTFSGSGLKVTIIGTRA